MAGSLFQHAYYIVNIINRWDEWKLPVEMRKIVACMKILLPQMHMLSHKESCQIDFAMCYKHGTGHSNGETVEIAWAILYEIGIASREMNGGARHDAICDSINGYNWDKMVGLCESHIRTSWRDVTHSSLFSAISLS